MRSEQLWHEIEAVKNKKKDKRENQEDHVESENVGDEHGKRCGPQARRRGVELTAGGRQLVAARGGQLVAARVGQLVAVRG